jgi:hypothetical protein
MDVDDAAHPREAVGRFVARQVEGPPPGDAKAAGQGEEEGPGESEPPPL